MNDLQYFRLDVIFERDMETVTLPLLGQMGFMGALKALVGREDILPFLDVIPAQEIAGRMFRELRNGSLEEALETIPAPHPQKWFPAAEGWKAAARIKAALRNPASVKKADLASFEAEVAAEADLMMDCLHRADDDNVRFRLSFEECETPNETQKRWMGKQYAGLAESLSKILKEAGIDLNEETGS